MIYIRSCCHAYDGDYSAGVFGSIKNASIIGGKDQVSWTECKHPWDYEGLKPTKVWQCIIDKHTCYYLYAYEDKDEQEETE